MINNKKLNAYLRKELRKLGRDYRREKERCARIYPDWKDDEFNMLDNLFIWGYNTNPTVVPSFESWDDAYIYYNRATKMYYMTIDTGFYNCNYDADLARVELERLDRINEAFKDFLIGNGFSMHAEIFPFKDPALEAYSLGELYTKFRIMVEGYKNYRVNINDKPQS